MSLGQRIAYLRQQHSLTLQDVADGASLTPSFLSRLERDQANISVGNLRKLARFFGVPMTYFFADEELGPVAVVVRANARPRLSQPSDPTQIYELAPLGSPVEARLIEAQPGAVGSSDAVQLLFVISGRLRCQVSAKAYALEGGDTLLVQRGAEISWECLGPERALALAVYVSEGTG